MKIHIIYKNETIKKIQEDVFYLGNELNKTNKRMEEGFDSLQKNIISIHDKLHNEIIETNKIMVTKEKAIYEKYMYLIYIMKKIFKQKN